jgi:hypothetical protein
MLWWTANGNQTSLAKFGQNPTYLDRGYNRYDAEILAFTNYFNAKFEISVDGNVIKAMAYVETKMGYFPGSATANGEIDIMQVLDPRNPAVYRLAAVSGQWSFDPNEGRRYIPSDGYDFFTSSLFPTGDGLNYNRSGATVDMSIAGGVLWYLVKGNIPEKYNVGDPGYMPKIKVAFNLMGIGR